MTNKADVDQIRAELEKLKAGQAKTCPSCGYCPTCGHRTSPYWPQPSPWYPRPYWQDPYITWTSGNTALDTGAKTFSNSAVVLGNTVLGEQS